MRGTSPDYYGFINMGATLVGGSIYARKLAVKIIINNKAQMTIYRHVCGVAIFRFGTIRTELDDSFAFSGERNAFVIQI